MNYTINRQSPALSKIENTCGVSATLIANQAVQIESVALDQLSENVFGLQETLHQLGNFGEIKRVVLTPDFHKGSGIPVGTVIETKGCIIPQAVGNDICCGMRVLQTDVPQEELWPILPKLKVSLREIFFQGKRNIPMSPKQREALLREGLYGLLFTEKENANQGLWEYFHTREQEEDTKRTHFQGTLPAKGIFAFEDFIRGSGLNASYDAQIGSIGGGNHFVELQCISKANGMARTFGLMEGFLTIMAHSGSVGLGHAVGGHFVNIAKSLYPKSMAHPKHGFYVIPVDCPEAAKYLDAMKNAANFAFANRLFLGLMVVRALSECLGRRVVSHLIYDAPHNLIWAHETGPDLFIHRKGACPAYGYTEHSPFQYTGHPVIVPGSMGSLSYILAGKGNKDLLQSACHGAGRLLSRGKAVHVDDDIYESSAGNLHVVTPIDPDGIDVRSRSDIAKKYKDRLKEEAPYAYKEITPVVASIEEAGVATIAASLKPCLTIKG